MGLAVVVTFGGDIRPGDMTNAEFAVVVRVVNEVKALEEAGVATRPAIRGGGEADEDWDQGYHSCSALGTRGRELRVCKRKGVGRGGRAAPYRSRTVPCVDACVARGDGSNSSARVEEGKFT